MSPETNRSGFKPLLGRNAQPLAQAGSSFSRACQSESGGPRILPSRILFVLEDALSAGGGGVGGGGGGGGLILR